MTLRMLLLAPVSALAVGCGSSPSPEPEPASPVAVRSGDRIYVSCRACHGADGKGIPGVYPSLVHNPILGGNDEVLIRITLHGYRSERGYTGLMDGFANQLSDGEIAELLSWMRLRWAPGSTAIAAPQVREVRSQYLGRRTPWTPVEFAAEQASPAIPQNYNRDQSATPP